MRRVSALIALVVLAIASVGAPVSAAEPGDDPATAIPVVAGVGTYDSSAMGTSAADPAACDPFPGPLSATMWFTYTAARDALTTVDVNSFVSADGSTDFLAVVFVYRVNGGPPELVGCSAYPATVVFGADGGATYQIMVAGLSAEATGEPELSDRGGTFDLSIAALRGRVQRDHFRSSETFVEEFLCSEPITISWKDNASFKTFYDRSGPRAATVFYSGWTSFARDGGSTLTLRYAQTFRETFDGTATIVGLAQDVWLDGKRVVKDVGRLVFDLETGSVIFEAGDHPQWYEGLDICEELGLTGFEG
jgi:hypothetical protein